MRLTIEIAVATLLVFCISATSAAFGASGKAGHSQEERAAVHAARTFSDTTIRMPKKTVMRAEMALITGLAPRRAMA